MPTISYFISPSPPRNHILAFNASILSVSLHTWLSINGLSTLQVQTPYFNLYSPAPYVTFLPKHTFRGGAAGRPEGRGTPIESAAPMVSQFLRL